MTIEHPMFPPTTAGVVLFPKPKVKRRRLRLSKADRRWIEECVQRMIDVLDAVDARYEDIEPDTEADLDAEQEGEDMEDREPSLGSTHSVNQIMAWKPSSPSLYTDAEHEHDGREPEPEGQDSEDEPLFPGTKGAV